MSTRSALFKNIKSPSAKSIIGRTDSKSDRFCSGSPFASDSEDIKIEGEDDFYQIYNSSVEAIAKKNGKESPSVSAAPRLASMSRDLEEDKKNDFENFVENNASFERVRKISNASDNIDRSTGARIIPDYVSVYSKPALNPEVNRTAGLTEAADNGRGRRYRATGESKQLHTKQEDMHRLQENRPAAKQPYLPAYIQPVVTTNVKGQASAAIDVTNSQVRRNVHQTSTVFMSDPLKKTDRIKRPSMRLGQNRLSSGSSDSSSSSDAAVDLPAMPKRITNSQRDGEGFDGIPEKATSRQTRKTRHRIRVAQRSTHTPDYLLLNRSAQSTGDVSQKALIEAANSGISSNSDNRLLYSRSNASRTPGGYHRSRTKHRKQHLVEMDERYSTLPANFSPANATDDALNNNDNVLMRLSQVQNKSSNEGNYKQPRMVNDMTITRKQTSSISEVKRRQDRDGRSDYLNQCTDSLSNQHNDANSNPQDKTSGLSERIHKSSSLPSRGRPKQVEELRSLFNSGKLSSPVPDRTLHDQQPQRRAKVNNRKTSKSLTPDAEEIVSSQPLLKAKKLSEDFWPRDEATEKLLNRNHVQSTESDKMTNNVLETVHEMERLPNQQSKNNDSSRMLSRKDLPTSPKETNLSDPVDQQAVESWTTRSRKQSGSSTGSYQLQGQNLYLRDVSPHTSTETLQASIRSGDTIEIPERNIRSRSLDGRMDPYLMEKLSSSKWRFDNQNTKLKESESTTSESNLSITSISEDNKTDKESDETYRFNDVDLDILPMRNIYLKGAPLYIAPKYVDSSLSQSENTLSADQMSSDSLPGDVGSVSSESMEDCSICRANSISGPSSGLQPISTSTRKTSVVSQSTALPRTPNGFSPGASTNPGDIDEGCFIEEDLISRPISMNMSAFNYPNFSLDNASRDNEQSDFTNSSNNRKPRKFSAAGQSNSSSSNISSSSNSDSTRSRSDPIPNRKKSLTSTENETGSVDSDFQYNLNPCNCSGHEEPTSNNSVSDLSGYSENASNQGDFSKTHDVIDDSDPINQALAEFESKNSLKALKKKSYSDPNAKAVLSAGLISKLGLNQEKGSIHNSCSDPALSEQAGRMDNSSKYRNYSQTSLHGTENIDDNAGIGDVTKSIEEMSHSIYSDQHLSMSPRTFRRVPSVKARKRAEQLRNGAKDEKIFQPIHPEDLTSSQSSSKTSSVVVDKALEQEEEQFHKLYEMMSSSSNDNLSATKKPVSHTRSCSEPAVSENINDRMARKMTDRGGRRAGLVQAPSFLAKDTQSQSNLLSSKPLSNSTERMSSTLPANMRRSEPNSRLDYNNYVHGREKLDMRKHVVNNLLETEASYVNSLRILFETYFKPLKRPENHSICEPRLVDEIFFQIPQILQQHQKFFANVSDCYDNWDPEDIKMGEVFMQSFNKDKLLESYTSYIKNYLNAREAVNIAIQARSAFKLFLEQCQRGSKDKQGLSDLMIKPVQRIPRYELIIKDLLKHTPEEHPDRESLLIAQKEIHALSVQMNKGEKDAEAAERHARLLQEIEQLIEGSIDIGGTSKRKFLHQDICYELKTGSKKERSLWLFNDMLVCTTSKKGGRASSLRRSSMNLFSMTPDRVMIDFTCRYKFMWKFPLDDVDLLKGSTGSGQLPNERQLQQLQSDQDLLHQIETIASKISIFHWQLDDTVKELLQVANQRITEKQQQARQSLSLPGRLEIGIPTQDGMKLFQFEFPSEENKTQFEHLFWEAKKNFTSQKSKWEPAFMKAIPISKTRNGMQFSCASPNVDTSPGTREVWVCNTDGYVGQICILTLEPEPMQSLCLTICNAKICCIAQVPPWDRKLVRTDTLLSEISVAPLGNYHTRRRSSSNSNPARYIISWDDSDESDEDNTSPISTLSNISPHSTNTSVSNMDLSSGGNEISPSEISSGGRIPPNSMMHALLGGGAYKKDNDGSTLHGSLEDLLMDDNNNVNGRKALSNNGSMWLGTEDGKIKIYSTSESLRSDSRPCVQLHHTAPVQCIVHHEGQVFVALSNGDLMIYNRMVNTGQWEFDSKKCLTGSSSNNPITKMIVVNDKELWCGCQNQIRILEIKNLNLKSFFPVSQDSKRQIHCMVWCGHGVWVALDRRPQVKLFNSITHDQITEIDVSHPVSKMLASSDAIIRQHKAACLRITSLLVYKDLLWVGTSAGVVLTVALPAINASTSSIPIPLMAQGLPYGHTGHVRFITSVEVMDPDSTNTGGRRSSIKRRASSASASSQIRTTALVISGGDGYEDFRMNPASEVAGREDSTNHLLVWRV